MISENDIWNLIDQAFNQASGNIKEQQNWLINTIKTFEDSEILDYIVAFERVLITGINREMRGVIFTMFGNTGDNDVILEDMLGELISHGKEAWKKYLSYPDSTLLSVIEMNETLNGIKCTGFRHVFMEAYAQKKQFNLDNSEEVEELWDILIGKVYVAQEQADEGNPEEKWTERELASTFPNLYQTYYMKLPPEKA